MRTRKEAGFTLVELLVAMALLALLSVLLVGGLRLSRGAVIRSEAASERLLRAELAFGVIRRQLERAEPLPLAGSDAPPHIAFTGDGQGIVFIAPPGAFLALGGEEITWLALERDNAGMRVVLRYRPRDRARDRWPPPLDAREMTTVPLIDGVSDARLAYFGRARSDQGPQWLAEWRDQAILPSLIRLAITGGGQSWPDLVLSPRNGRPVDTGLVGSGLPCGRGASFPC